MKKCNLKVSSFEEAFSFSSLLEAHLRCRCNKNHKREVVEFELNLFDNLTKLSQMVLSGKYKIVKYRQFTIYEPKERNIECLNYRHRLVQYALCKKVLEPMLEPRLIYCNSACRCGKGTDFARGMFEKYLRIVAKKFKGNAFFFKCDVKKYFASINHNILLDKLSKVGFDSKTFNLIKMIIESNGEPDGLPIGNLTSQWFALFYLDKIDRIIKEKFGIKYYVRYMDDLVIISDNKKLLENCKNDIINEGHNSCLSFNKKTQISKVCEGVSFIGFRYIITKKGKVCKVLIRKTKRKIAHNMRRMEFLIKNNIVDNEFIQVRFASYINFYKNTSMEYRIVQFWESLRHRA